LSEGLRGTGSHEIDAEDALRVAAENEAACFAVEF